MAVSIQIGDLRCHILSDGAHHADGGGFFGLIPRVLWQRVIQPDANNYVPAADRSLLIESPQGLILVDTGFGDKLDAKARGHAGLEMRNQRLVGDLHNAGFAPEQVDVVVLTHFHGDHVGGATWRDDEGALHPTFPNARHVGQMVDYLDAMQPNERTAATYLRDNWAPLQDGGLLELVEGEQEIAPGVRTQLAPGHTAALQVVWVESRGETLLFLGDAASWGAHLERLAWVPSFDILPMVSIETKRALRQEALERNALLLFQHDPHLVTARLAAGDKGIALLPEITA